MAGSPADTLSILAGALWVPEHVGAATGPQVEELVPPPDPWEVCHRLADLPHLLFLDSGGDHPELAHCSYVTADPFVWLTARDRLVTRNGQALGEADPFAVLAEELARFGSEPIAGLPPFQGGAAGLFSYDLCHHLERLPRPRFDEFAVPDLAVGLYDWVVAFDWAQGRAWIISTGWPETEAARRERRAVRRRRWLRERLQAVAPPPPRWGPVAEPLVLQAPTVPAGPLPGVLSNFSRADYLAAVQRAIDYVHAGDCFQVNLSQRLLYPAQLPPLELYRRLRERNPAPFAGYFDLGDFVLASASPERFLRLEQGVVTTRPIKGTRPRLADPSEDAARRRDLLASTKDRAENVMIVDLLRNDLGRVCRYGSIRVEALCRLETFRFVHHLVSEVRGELRPGLGPIDLLRATFPGGSVTGAPKIRAMEIIAELEPTARGPYCGSLGWISFAGDMDCNILIRTFTIGRGWCQFPVGGGIVADSTPEREYDETWHKAEGLLRALR
ncbi:MAG: aminodeoxychorismate synthase component I [Gemmataceae bacterium]|nr:aminodeoxychorismate synthase component I [Gemmataceae bacterium]MDW8264794.1 aminodeoxychorismate synthase component I [Gemmataceae bacterium]